ncbi:MAG TPA: 2,3-bisphosphoglycerate-dependent phosphoglycerate mutase, partial [Rugosimonospora sp.]|nr:2,3-bisphosphoglycerate-dependent phosphoglycerate mutase [Rugosimonospora sp.]
MGTTTPLILVRHGESEWNDRNLFAGWADVDLTARGIAQAVRAGELLREHGELPDVAHTSLLRRSVLTGSVVLHGTGRAWVPVHRSWRLNERHYGALQGRDKADVRAEYGEEQFRLWRRSYEGLPPPLSGPEQRLIDADPRYRGLCGAIPAAESLRDVGTRLLPHYQDAIGADLRAGRRV